MSSAVTSTQPFFISSIFLSIILPVASSIITALITSLMYNRLHKNESISAVRRSSLQLKIEEVPYKELLHSEAFENSFLFTTIPQELKAGGGYSSNLSSLSTQSKFPTTANRTLYLMLRFKNVGNFDSVMRQVIISRNGESIKLDLHSRSGRNVNSQSEIIWYVAKPDCPTSFIFDYPDYELSFDNVNGNRQRLHAPKVTPYVKRNRRKQTIHLHKFTIV